jgi:4-carboxymuconolactone decarboxylase
MKDRCIHKIVLFLKRREGMSVADFRDYYETKHSVLCKQYMRGAERYIRRYVDPMIDPTTGEAAALDFDVITELWFSDKAVFDMTVEMLSRGVALDDVVEDEKQLFDRTKMRYATVTEYETDVSPTEDVPNRIPRLPREEWTDASREVCAFWGEPNAWEEGSKTYVIMVMANHPELGKVYNIWGKHLLMANTVPIRPREMIILRVGWNLKSGYEWHNHVGYGLNAGLTLGEIAAIREGPDAPNWNDDDRAVLRAVDEQMEIGRITDPTWAKLAAIYDKKQLMDLVFTIGHYVMIGWSISSLGVRLEDGADRIGFDLQTQSGRTPGLSYKPGENEDWIKTRGY